MSIVDILIIIFIITGAAVGAKDGFMKSLIKLTGLSVVLTLSYLLKNPVSELYMNIFPFFPFGGVIKGLTVLNIAVYELLAFASLCAIFTVILKIVLKATGIFEKLVSLTIILGVPSKILGGILGLIKNYVITFFVLYYLAMPNFYDVSVVKNSKIKEPILKNTPILSTKAKNISDVIYEFTSLTEKYKNSSSTNEFNLETLDLFLKYKITTPENIRKLSENGKIKIAGLDEVLKKYETQTT